MFMTQLLVDDKLVYAFVVERQDLHFERKIHMIELENMIVSSSFISGGF